jgi:hypothetical protein
LLRLGDIGRRLLLLLLCRTGLLRGGTGCDCSLFIPYWIVAELAETLFDRNRLCLDTMFAVVLVVFLTVNSAASQLVVFHVLDHSTLEEQVFFYRALNSGTGTLASNSSSGGGLTSWQMDP